MEWRERDGVKWLEADLGGARAAFSARLGGVSKPPFDSLNLGILTEDDSEAVAENRRRLATALGLDPAQVVYALQVHGTRLLDHNEVPSQSRGSFRTHFDQKEPRDDLPRADGHVVRGSGLAPLVFVADCLPVALLGSGGLAMVHAGWRGLAGGIVGAAAEAVQATAAAIGPGVGPCCYEVGPEVLDAFADLGAGIAEGRMLDLPEVALRKLAQAGVEKVESAGLCTSCEHELFFSHRRDHGRTGRHSLDRGLMAELIHDIDAAKVAANLEEVRAVAGNAVEILVATKYVPLEEMGKLAEAGVQLVGENRQQDLAAKHERWGDAFDWDFIGNLQSRKLKLILPLCRLIHSVATNSVLAQLEKHGTPETEVLVEVNVSGEEGKGGVEPGGLADFIERCPVRVSGLMTMPPFSEDPEHSRPYFARLAELAASNGLERLSMGTSQDWRVAVEEGATIIRLGHALFV
jgi:YfiH family protein